MANNPDIFYSTLSGLGGYWGKTLPGVATFGLTPGYFILPFQGILMNRICKNLS